MIDRHRWMARGSLLARLWRRQGGLASSNLARGLCSDCGLIEG